MNSLSHLLKESWALVEERQEKVAGHFYARVFLSNPRLRDLFPVTMDVQRTRLLAALVTAVQTVEDPDHFDEYLRALGRDHRKFEVDATHYGAVGEALLDALRTYAGPRWSVAYEQAWADAYAAIAKRMISGAQADSGPARWYAEVLHHERRGRDIAVFTCRPTEPLPYHAGQYVSVECHYQPRLWRTYSIANAPRADNTLDFHVRGRGSGVSGTLVRRLRPGDTIRIASPMGAMTLDPTSTSDVLCVAGGTGLAPIKALIEELGRHNATRWVHLFFGARTSKDLYDLDELYGFVDRYPWLTLVPACSDDSRFYGERGPIGEVVRRQGPWDHHDVYVSGPAEMVEDTLAALTGLGVPRVRVKYDAFSPW